MLQLLALIDGRTDPGALGEAFRPVVRGTCCPGYSTTVDDRIARPRGPYLGMLNLPSCLNAVQRWYGRCTRPVASDARCGPSRDELVDIVGAASTR